MAPRQGTHQASSLAPLSAENYRQTRGSSLAELGLQHDPTAPADPRQAGQLVQLVPQGADRAKA